jgi:hypothetical protein
MKKFVGIRGLAAEHPHHLIAVARAAGLKVLPRLRALVDPHVLHREGLHLVAVLRAGLLLLALDVPAVLTLDVVVRALGGALGVPWRRINRLRARCVAYFPASMPIQRRPRRSAASRVVPDPMKQSSTSPPGRARRRDDPLDKRNGLLRGVVQAIRSLGVHGGDIVPDGLDRRAIVV